jgi:hypothetical protein
MVFRVKCPKTILKDKTVENVEDKEKLLNELVVSIGTLVMGDDTLSDQERAQASDMLKLFGNIDPKDPESVPRFIEQIQELEQRRG